MNDDRHVNDAQLTRAVRSAFDRYRLDVPVGVVMTERATGRHRWRLLAVPAVAAALALAVIVQPFARPQSAFASWTAVPTAADPALAAAAEADCRTAAGPDITVALPLIGQDQRGLTAMALFSDGQQFALCLVVNDAPGADGPATGGIGLIGGQMEPLKGSSTTLTEGRAGGPGFAVTTMAGRVSDQVAKVEIVRSDGVVVTATITDGFFLAWWPSDAGSREVRAYDASGQLLR